MLRFLLIVGILGAAVAYFWGCCRHEKEELLMYPETTIWGRSKPDDNITPFTYKADPKDIEDLKTRLARWRRHEPLEGVGHTYGFAGEGLDKLVKYWREKYDFNGFEAKVNSLPQYTTVINGLKVHFLHVKGDVKAKKRVPLLLVHGWPGSVLEFYRLIPLLTSVGKDGTTFDVIAPSIPGFGFSEAAVKPGFNPIAIAQVLHSLMMRVGYEKYVYQGGDWGALLGNLVSRMYPDNVIAFHFNFVTTPFYSAIDFLHYAAVSIAPKLLLSEKDQKRIAKESILMLLLEEGGYFHEQATKPDTLGVGLSDSPVGVAAWIGEKFDTVSEHAELKGDVGKGISNDDFLHNIMLYWLNNKITSASRIYKEYVHVAKQVNAWAKQVVTVPVGIACYPRDAPCAPTALLKRTLPYLVHDKDMPRGGHFAAMEEPELFNEDFREAVATFFKVIDERKKK